jgi:beta-glucosidase
VSDRMRERCRILVLIVYSGRPVMINDMIDRSDAVVAAWLPGSDATELPDLLLGWSEFEGRLTEPWPVSSNDMDPRPSRTRFPIQHGLAE